MEAPLDKAFGGQNMVDPIRRLIVKHPEDAYYDQDKICLLYTSDSADE